MRADFAKIQNQVLEEKGFSVRVDHRSLKAQRDDAIKNGDKFLAELLNRVPEKNLPPIPLDDESPSVKELKKQREERGKRADFLFNDLLLSQKSEREKIKKFTASFSLDSINFLCSTEVNNSDADNLQSLKTKILNWTREISALRHSFISTHDAEEQAKLEYMSLSEKSLYRNFQEIKSRRDNLQKFLSNFQKPVYDPDKSFEKICEEVKQQMKTYNASLKFLQSAFDQLEQKLQSPQLRKNIQLATHNILKQNFFVREKLKVATDNLISATEKLRDEIFKTATQNQKYQLRELANFLFHHYLALKKDREKLLAHKISVSKKILSLARAQKLAENIFVGGAWKKYRDDFRLFDKHKSSMHPVQKNYLAKKLEVEKNRLLNFCSKPDSQKKIAEISVGILRKNSNLSKKVAAIDSQIKNLSSQINHLYTQLATLKKILTKEKPNTFYKLRSSPDHKPTKNILEIASTIAEAFLGDSNAVSITARITDKGFEMEKDWDSLSELDKIELVHKKTLARI